MNRIRFLVVLLLLAAVLGIPMAGKRFAGADFAIHVLDVGQGDAILMRTSNVDILVDGGPDHSVLHQMDRFRMPWDRTVEVIVLTHAHADHMRGLTEVMKRYDVGLVLLPDIPYDSEPFRKFLDTLLENEIPARAARPGQRIIAGDLRVDVIAPDATLLDWGSRHLNNGSVALRARFHQHTALLTGDLEASAEQYLVRTVPHLLSADIMQAPHHGSRSSSSALFVQAVDPSVAFASAGSGNRHGHPSREVVERYERLGIPFVRTDVSGTVSFLFSRDGSFTRIRCDRECVEVAHEWDV